MRNGHRQRRGDEEGKDLIAVRADRTVAFGLVPFLSIKQLFFGKQFSCIIRYARVAFCMI